jgi:polar amino acid transport system substrate-binding protein
MRFFMGCMMGRKLLLTGCLLVGICVAGQAQTSSNQPVLIVGTKEAPPFAMKGPDGKWTGISIELWRDLAAKLGWKYKFREMSLEQLLAGLTNNTVDVAVAAISVTSDRERVMDFTHPFFHTGLGIAVAGHRGAAGLTVLRDALSWKFFTVVGLLILVLLGVGFLVWLFERRDNAEHFGGKPLHGIGSAFWWSAVTMTTVGYGDKTPRTLGGRFIALIWMFTAIIIISSFTAAITSALTVSQFGSPIRGPRDLPGARVGGVAGSTGELYLGRQHIACRNYPTAADALRALADGQLDAVVYDAPILQYLARQNYPGDITVLPRTFVPQDYAIAVPEGSPMREQLDRVLESEIRSPQWQELVSRYLGDDE